MRSASLSSLRRRQNEAGLTPVGHTLTSGTFRLIQFGSDKVRSSAYTREALPATGGQTDRILETAQDIGVSRIHRRRKRGLWRMGFIERIRGSHHIFTHNRVAEILNLQPRAEGAE